MNHGLGCLRDTHDARDLRFSSVANQSSVALELPPSVDLRPLCSPVRDQGHLGSCTGFATVVGLYEALNRPYDPDTRFSPLFEYYWERWAEHTVAIDAGAMIRDGMRVLAKFGAGAEDLWPYDVTRFKERPSDESMMWAKFHKIAAYHRIHNLIEAKQALALNQPVVAGIEIWDSFESPDVARTGMVPVPNRDVEQCLGGHAVCIVGYNDAQRHFIVKNSWSENWGDRGYFYLSYDWVRPDLGLVSDLWTGSV